MSPGELFTLLGFLCGGIVLYFAAKRRRLATEGMWWLVGAGLAGGILGAKVTEALAEGRGPLSGLIDPSQGGRALLGGVVVGWLSVELAKRRLGIRRSTGDLFALALPAGEAVGRIGCYLNGCCFGKESSVPWAIYQHGAFRHPTQIYSAVVAALIFGLLWFAEGRLKQDGQLFRAYLLLFGLSRLGLEFLRDGRPVFAGLTAMQWMCLDLVAVAVIGFVVRRRSAEAKA